ncbi:septal ring lytic transglycosylase RlpA family protein [Paraburkholderia caribensis]|uniref:septal ring lytic transglycosylase RlpA family protein n=1 Tax=Paraburkholderia caribensis TaxID=75105 RepID=UPI001ABB15A7|nr:septal ring lytic transglycosylase RlpA family protein [Paraburkholderia caribensis]
MSTVRLFVLLGIFGLFAGCAQMPSEHQASSTTGIVSTPIAPIDADSVSDNAPAQAQIVALRPARDALQTGQASWYARKFEGRRTANGERYNGQALTAAHRTLPFGTYVRVTSLSTAKTVVVRINDRGPFVKGRVIDLSYAAASALGLTRAPSMNVQIERVEKQADTRTASGGSES